MSLYISCWDTRDYLLVPVSCHSRCVRATLYLLALLLALTVPGLGFKLAYGSIQEEARSVLEVSI